MRSAATNDLRLAAQRLAAALQKSQPNAQSSLEAAVVRLQAALRQAASGQVEIVAACAAISLPTSEPCDLLPSDTISAATALRTNLLAWQIERDPRPTAVIGTLAMLATLAAYVDLAAPNALEQVLAALDVPAESVAVANEIGQQFAQLVDSLEQPDPRPLAELGALLNPDSGRHLIPNDMREIRAALRAAEESWHAQPYYAARYPERGVCFTYSDSCWLTSLCDLPEAELQRQIHWLGRVLAARGMPRFLLEQHLTILYCELAAAAPERAPSYALLAKTADQLAAERRISHDDQGLAALEASFDAAVGAEWATRLPHIGQLIGAAIADERAGIANAASSLLGWLADPAHFPHYWCDAVIATASLARLPQGSDA